MNEVAIKNLQERHKEIYTQVLSNRLSLLNNRYALEDFVKKADDLVKDITEASKSVKSIDDYTWLTNAVVQLQAVFSSLNLPRNIQIYQPNEFETFLPTEKPLSNDEIENWIKERAEVMSSFRRANRYIKIMSMDLWKFPSAKEEMDTDWYNANVQFASEIILGRIKFSQIQEISYPYIENSWFKEVKQLRAYYNWLSRVQKNQPGDAYSDYYEACKAIRDILFDSSIKIPLDFFEKNVKVYLEKHYLSNGRINEAKSDVSEMIRNKAYKIWEVTGNNNSDKNWKNAKTYVQGYYQNIIPAIVAKDKESIKNIINTFQFSKASNNRYLIINCFEALLVIYFIDVSTLNQVIKENNISKDSFL